MPRALSPRQYAVYQFIAEFIRQHHYAPSLKEICAEFDLRAISGAHVLVKHLEDKGWVVRHRNTRSIELVIHAGSCPTCGQSVPTARVEATTPGARA